jgi:site-specific recombinase XerC
MPRSRPTSNPLSYHKHTSQYYVTRSGKRLYLGTDRDEALEKYHRMNLGLAKPDKPIKLVPLNAKELENRFLASQQANWRNPETTLRSYKDWIGRFLKDHPKLKIQDFTVEMFAAWKMSLRKRDYSPESINHYLSAIRSMFIFAEETGLLQKSPTLRRVKNESIQKVGSKEKPLYSLEEISSLLEQADIQMRAMLLHSSEVRFAPFAGLIDLREEYLIARPF